jgi:hypothetical protein
MVSWRQLVMGWLAWGSLLVMGWMQGMMWRQGWGREQGQQQGRRRGRGQARRRTLPGWRMAGTASRTRSAACRGASRLPVVSESLCISQSCVSSSIAAL